MMSFLSDMMENNYESMKRLNKKKRDLEVAIERAKIKKKETESLSSQLASNLRVI